MRSIYFNGLKNSVIYARVSTNFQQGSIQHQINYLRKFGAGNNLKISDTFFDIGSGTNIDNLQQLQELKNVEESIILVRDVSRLGRESVQVNSLIKSIHERGSIIYSAIENINSLNTHFKTLVDFSEKNLELQKSMQTIAIDNIKKCGGHLGRPPYGYRVYNDNFAIPRLVKYEPEYYYIRRIVNFAKLGLPVEAITDRLNEYKTGVVWTVKKVKKIIEKESLNV